MLIDCTTCVARDVACGDCVISVLLASPPVRSRRHDDPRATDPSADPAVDLDDAARAALGHLASAGLVPPLRLVAPVSSVDNPDDAVAGAGIPGNDREIA